MLAREFAKRMNYQGGYCIVRHMPGGSPFFSRTYGMITELNLIHSLTRVIAEMPHPERTGFERLQRPLSFRVVMR